MEMINIKDIGPVLFEVNNRAKRLSIRLKPFDGVKVIVPINISIKEAVVFVQSNRVWIQQNMIKIRDKESELTIFDEGTQFKTRAFDLHIQKSPLNKIQLQLKDKILYIYYPQNQDVKSPIIQENIRYGIEEAMRISAKNYLPKRLYSLAQEFNFTYNKVFIKNLKSRWGSCSYVDNINLNLHLMRLPDHLIDYVLLHELCHTKEKNHGPKFWQLLNEVGEGSAKLLDKEMKQYKTVIY